ncbi:hypothetical protein BVJ53_01895 [Lacticaseibacillus chiayiensis]|uniref:DUF6290 family protein n=1 Tax=Lacticaseibacillus chiayiensis TaxID=2100821 RepID=A0A4Q1UDK2_9LACO|nr:DUF6290 family protein [Lacticaseibacillus chiayiensis]QVI34666.1 hypothetical protein KG086_13020 [Lacticaseibacillus chiayiensis]RXT29731.1 hypothetical protein BVJ53_01895 [Lacticaseibacillus chiayiensis]UYN56415.1 DUF6290 family protein [Lacticaseibacillus chiayiensis]
MADTTVTYLRFNNDQYKKIKELADFHGVSVTKYMREAILERLEDEEDYNDAMANLSSSHGETVSSAEIRTRLALS